MELELYKAENYRNIENISFEPSAGVNIIFGDNAQGKTNLIESIWLFTGFRSFRTMKTTQLVREGQDFARLEIDFFSSGRSQNAQMFIDNKRLVKINGITQESPRNLLGEFKAVVFSPVSLAVVQDGPSEKRRFLDIAISLIKPNYAAFISRYLKTMAHRNALLRQMGEKRGNDTLLEPWDYELAATGAKIISYRYEYLEKLKEKAAHVYDGISAGREKMELEYIGSFKSSGKSEKELGEAMLTALIKNRDSDIRRQQTSVGPHKDDLNIKINGLCARTYGSQGQQRSCALALKLGEAAVITQSGGERPIALLDDVMSELDAGRQAYLLDYLKGWQVFITCCDPSILDRSQTEKVFQMKGGQISSA